MGGGTPLADEFLQIKVGGDLALFQALGHLLLEEEERVPGTVVDQAFIDAQTDGFEAYREARTRARLGGDREGHRAVPDADRRQSPGCSSSPRRPSSAGRWA